MTSLLLGALIAAAVILVLIFPEQILGPPRRAFGFLLFFGASGALILGGLAFGFLVVVSGVKSNNAVVVALGILLAAAGVFFGGAIGYAAWTEKLWRK